MSDLALQLHSALRLRAQDEHRRWSKQYEDSGASDRPQSREARALFPRYLIHEAIQEAVERIDSESLSSLPESRARLIAAIHVASTAATVNVIADPIARAAMEEERTSMIAYASDIREEALVQIAPMPYRHVLTASEGTKRWTELATRWGIDDHYWYPLSGNERSDLIAFDAGSFSRDVRPSRLQAALESLGVKRVWEFSESGLSAEIDLALLDPVYTGDEWYWSSIGCDWILYASHESSLAIGGTALKAVQDVWPAWQQHVWTGAY